MSGVRPVRTGEQVATSEPLITIKSAAKVYGTNLGLAPLSLAIHAGERVALVGPSGSGKTTLLRLLAGAMVPDEGPHTVSINGKSPAGLKPGNELASLVGIVSQRFDLVPHLPVLHNVLAGRLGHWSLARSILSLVWPMERRAAQQALARVGIADKINERPGHLSGGEQQRVAIARMMMQSPLVILADEPVASLDPARAEEVMELLVGLVSGNSDGGDSQRALVASLHTASLIRRHFTRVIGLRESRVQFDLPASELDDAVLDELYDLGDDAVAMEPLAGLAARDG
ncbi:MAG: ATP-binding cassette domain-containing protein [Chloroflexi bacterium]|nr:ATP-binding cassette domain-containing protein [Chloroflexota bacterium]